MPKKQRTMHKSASRLTFIAEIKGLFKIFCHDGKKSYNYSIKIDFALRKNRPQYILQKEKRFETKAKPVCVTVNVPFASMTFYQ